MNRAMAPRVARMPADCLAAALAFWTAMVLAEEVAALWVWTWTGVVAAFPFCFLASEATEAAEAEDLEEWHTPRSKKRR